MSYHERWKNEMLKQDKWKMKNVMRDNGLDINDVIAIINSIKIKHYERFCDGEIECQRAY